MVEIVLIRAIVVKIEVKAVIMSPENASANQISKVCLIVFDFYIGFLLHDMYNCYLIPSNNIDHFIIYSNLRNSLTVGYIRCIIEVLR